MGIENGILRTRRVVFGKSTVILLALAIGLAAASTQIAFSDPSNESKLTIGNIMLNPTSEGDFTANVNLYLRRANSPQINLSVDVQHVKTIDEVYDKLRPSVDHLADELKNAGIERLH